MARKSAEWKQLEQPPTISAESPPQNRVARSRFQNDEREGAYRSHRDSQTHPEIKRREFVSPGVSVRNFTCGIPIGEISIGEDKAQLALRVRDN